LPWGHSSAAVGFVSHSNHIAARWGKVSDGTATIFAPSHTLTLQAQRFLLSASARSLFVTALERLKSIKRMCSMSSCHEPLSSNAGKIVSVRFSEEDLAMLEKCRVVEVSTGVTVQLPKATLIRQLCMGACLKMLEEKSDE
jgi:hypothetical protein